MVKGIRIVKNSSGIPTHYTLVNNPNVPMWMGLLTKEYNCNNQELPLDISINDILTLYNKCKIVIEYFDGVMLVPYKISGIPKIFSKDSLQTPVLNNHVLGSIDTSKLSTILPSVNDLYNDVYLNDIIQVYLIIGEIINNHKTNDTYVCEPI